MLLLSLHTPWWSVFYNKTKMVDLQLNLEALWPDTSLFGDEPIDAINIDDLLVNEKANSKENQAVLSLPGLGWFDEKVDLSVLVNPNSLPVHHNETQPLMEDESAILFGFLGDSFDPSYLTEDIFKNEEVDFSKLDVPDDFVIEPPSSEILDSHLASPQCNSLQVNSPIFHPAQSPASPYSDISDAYEESSLGNVLQSPQSPYAASNSSCSSFDSSQIKVTVCDNILSSSGSEPVLSIEEISRSLRKRKLVSSDVSKPKVVKVMFPEDIPMRSKRPAARPKDTQERKKVQNKEAAARYRIKKRMEEKVLSDEVEGLESQQKELQEKHDKLLSEIKYLKSLMCEILTKNGIMK